MIAHSETGVHAGRMIAPLSVFLDPVRRGGGQFYEIFQQLKAQSCFPAALKGLFELAFFKETF